MPRQPSQPMQGMLWFIRSYKRCPQRRSRALRTLSACPSSPGMLKVGSVQPCVREAAVCHPSLVRAELPAEGPVELCQSTSTLVHGAGKHTETEDTETVNHTIANALSVDCFGKSPTAHSWQVRTFLFALDNATPAHRWSSHNTTCMQV